MVSLQEFSSPTFVIGITSTDKREELRFALANGYKLEAINLAYSFQKGVNTFLDLIELLNSMKIEAQQDKKPTIRNIAKLLMNSMYGRFGMHTDDLRHGIFNQDQITKLQKHFIVKDCISLGGLWLISYNLNSAALNLGSINDKT